MVSTTSPAWWICKHQDLSLCLWKTRGITIASNLKHHLLIRKLWLCCWIPHWHMSKCAHKPYSLPSRWIPRKQNNKNVKEKLYCTHGLENQWPQKGDWCSESMGSK
jgi:hypothetical protein